MLAKPFSTSTIAHNSEEVSQWHSIPIQCGYSSGHYIFLRGVAISEKMKGGVNGQISLAQMRETFEGEVLICSMARDIASLKRSMMQNAEVDDNGEPKEKKFKWHQHSDGMMRRVPSTWAFPMLVLQHVYQQWHSGNKLKEPPHEILDK